MGKRLLHELKQYIRCLWPFAIAVVVMCAVAILMLYFDRNPVESTGSMSAVGLFILTCLSFAARGVLHGYEAFYKGLTSEKEERAQSVNRFLWTHICAFLIFVVVTALLGLVFILSIAWQFVWQFFVSLRFLQFVFYAIVFTLTIYIVPIAMITAKHFDSRKKLVFGVGIVTLIFCAITIVPEVLFLANDTSTDVFSALTTVISLLVIFTFVDIWLYILTYRTLKTE